MTQSHSSDIDILQVELDRLNAQADALLQDNTELDFDIGSLNIKALRKKQLQLIDDNKRQKLLVQKIQITSKMLQRKINALTDINHKRGTAIERLKGVIEKKEHVISKLKHVILNKEEANERLRQSKQSLKDALEKVRITRDRFKVRASFFSDNPALNRYLRFARRAYENSEHLQADVYCAHGVQAMVAAIALREKHGGKAVCDCIEIPAFALRAIPSRWHPIMLSAIDTLSEGYLRQADHLLTIGWTMAEHLKKYNPDVRVVPNYRMREKLVRNNYLRETFKLPRDAKILLSASTITDAFEYIIEAMALLPSDVHLVTLGRFAPQQYKDEIFSLVEKHKLGERVHFHEPVPYENLMNISGGADIGLIVLDPQVPNYQASLPNRVFDYMAAGLPTITPDIPDISKVVTENNYGVVVDDAANPNEWVEKIGELLSRGETPFLNAERAAKQLTWEAIEADLPAIFGNPKTITFLGFEDLTKNNRTMRMVNSLSAHGIKVIIAGSKDFENAIHPGITTVKLTI